jgi:hypothetical protein
VIPVRYKTVSMRTSIEFTNRIKTEKKKLEMDGQKQHRMWMHSYSWSWGKELSRTAANCSDLKGLRQVTVGICPTLHEDISNCLYFNCFLHRTHNLYHAMMNKCICTKKKKEGK